MTEISQTNKLKCDRDATVRQMKGIMKEIREQHEELNGDIDEIVKSKKTLLDCIQQMKTVLDTDSGKQLPGSDNLHKTIKKVISKCGDDKKLTAIANLVVKTISQFENRIEKDMKEMQKQKLQIMEFVASTAEAGRNLSLKRKDLEKDYGEEPNKKQRTLHTHLFQLVTYGDQEAKVVFRRKQPKKDQEE